MVEFAFVVVLLIALLYGIISYGLILAAQSTITQAAADGARAGIVQSSTASCGPLAPPAPSPPPRARPPATWAGWTRARAATAGTTITCVATEAACPSNANNQCLTVTVIVQLQLEPALP